MAWIASESRTARHRFAPRHRPPDCTVHQLHPSRENARAILRRSPESVNGPSGFGRRPGPPVWVVIYVRLVSVFVHVWLLSLAVGRPGLSLRRLLSSRCCFSDPCTSQHVFAPQTFLPGLWFFFVTSSLVFVPGDPSNASVAPTASAAARLWSPTLPSAEFSMDEPVERSVIAPDVGLRLFRFLSPLDGGRLASVDPQHRRLRRLMFM